MPMIKFNRSNKPLTPLGVVLHETATAGATAQNEWDYFNSKDVKASAHAFVDWNGVIQAIPYDEQAWHAGATANKCFIGIEMCNTLDYNKFCIIWDNTINLISDLFIQFNLGYATQDNFMSHDEVSKKWGETNHTDPVNYFKTFGRSVEGFRDELNKAIFKKRGEKILNVEVKEMDLDRAISILKEKGIINTPVYWVTACEVVNYLKDFIINIATYIENK